MQKMIEMQTGLLDTKEKGRNEKAVGWEAECASFVALPKVPGSPPALLWDEHRVFSGVPLCKKSTLSASAGFKSSSHLRDQLRFWGYELSRIKAPFTRFTSHTQPNGYFYLCIGSLTKSCCGEGTVNGVLVFQFGWSASKLVYLESL